MTPDPARDTLRACLSGPIASLRTIFHSDGRIDFEGVRRYVDFVIAAGTKTVMLTFGDSLFSLLSDQEVFDLTRVVIEQTAGRALVVAADRGWATGQAVAFARAVREMGADMLMSMPPGWGDSCTPRTLAEHYRAVAAQIPVMVVTNVFIPRGMAFGLETLRIARDEVENVVAIKDDWCNEFARKMSLLVYDRWAVISGGQKQYHLDLLPYGCDGYLSTFLAFAPHIAHSYWKAVESRDMSTASRIIHEYDLPFFDFALAMPGGFDAAIHGALELFGVANRWRRAPYDSLSDSDMSRLADFFRSKGLL